MRGRDAPSLISSAHNTGNPAAPPSGGSRFHASVCAGDGSSELEDGFEVYLEDDSGQLTGWDGIMERFLRSRTHPQKRSSKNSINR